jgi:hypothetical protein
MQILESPVVETANSLISFHNPQSQHCFFKIGYLPEVEQLIQALELPMKAALSFNWLH